MGAVESGRIPNAYLFAGADAAALHDEAVFFASLLNCDTKKACGVCDSCKKILKGVHPDLLVLSGVTGSIKIDEIRQISEYVRYGPASGKWKVVVIGNADLMTPEACASLLKTLEEPHQNILFILTTVREPFVPRTIISRCQKILFFNEMNTGSNEAVNEISDKFMNIENMDIPGLLDFSSQLADNEDLEEILNLSLHGLREKIHYSDRRKFLSLKWIIGTLRSLEKNSNRKLALDAMVLSLKGGGQ